MEWMLFQLQGKNIQMRKHLKRIQEFQKMLELKLRDFKMRKMREKELHQKM